MFSLKKAFSNDFLLRSDVVLPEIYILLVVLDYVITQNVINYGIGRELSPFVKLFGFIPVICFSFIVFNFVWIKTKDIQKRITLVGAVIGLYFMIYLWHYIVIFTWFLN